MAPLLINIMGIINHGTSLAWKFWRPVQWLASPAFMSFMTFEREGTKSLFKCHLSSRVQLNGAWPTFQQRRSNRPWPSNFSGQIAPCNQILGLVFLESNYCIAVRGLLFIAQFPYWDSEDLRMGIKLSPPQPCSSSAAACSLFFSCCGLCEHFGVKCFHWRKWQKRIFLFCSSCINTSSVENADFLRWESCKKLGWILDECL